MVQAITSCTGFDLGHGYVTGYWFYAVGVDTGCIGFDT